MINVIDTANYFLKKDKAGQLFNKKLIQRNGRIFYEGNARLNIYLQLAQNIYIAKTGKKLIDADLFAYDNGAVVLEVQQHYQILLNNISNVKTFDFKDEGKEFLDKIYIALESADIDELIELAHEDSEWIDKNKNFMKDAQKMDSLRCRDIYQKQYSNFIWALDRIDTKANADV